MIRLHNTFRTAALPVVAAFLLAGCGGGGGGGGSSPLASSLQPLSNLSNASQVSGGGTTSSSGSATSTGSTSTAATPSTTPTTTTSSGTSTTSTSSTSSGTSTTSTGSTSSGTGTTAPSAAPITLYTDVVAGPTSGGENNDGMYLSIFGKNFGSSLSQIQVTIGGHPVAKVFYLGASMGRPDVQQLSLQVGSLGGAAQGTPLPIVVTVGGVASNNNLTFTPNPGNICYVSNSAGTTPEGTAFPAGNDSTGACGDIHHPFASVQGTSEYTGGAWPNAGPGDTIVLLPSPTPYQESGFEGYFMRFYRGPGSSNGGGGLAPTGARGTGYTTLMGYPGATGSAVPFISAPYSKNSSGAVSGSDTSSTSPYIVVANLRINGGGGDGAVNAQIMSNYARVVNNNLSATTAQSAARAGCIAGDGYHMEILGNSCHDVNSPDSGLENHGVYIDAAGSDEIAYNFLYDINDGNGVQLYNSQSVTPTIDNVAIHHNWIYNVAKHGVNVADTSGTGIQVYDNIIANTADGGIRFNSSDLRGCKVFNNTFYNTDVSGNPGYGAIMNDWTLAPGAVTFANNIFYIANGTPFLGGSGGVDSSGATFSNNVFYGGSDISTASALDPHAIVADPLFEAAPAPLVTPASPTNQLAIAPSQAFSLGYFALQSKSPALGAGSTGVSLLVHDDFALVPVGASYDIGALH